MGPCSHFYWRAGQRDRAIAAWREAQQRDPRDGKWLYKLRSVANGRDPLGGSTSDWWRQDDG